MQQTKVGFKKKKCFITISRFNEREKRQIGMDTDDICAFLASLLDPDKNLKNDCFYGRYENY